MDYEINFPHLGIYLEHVGKNITIGNLTIAYYGIVIAVGMLLGIWALCARAKETGQKADDYVDISVWTMIFAIVGARIYYVAFAWDMYKDNPLSVFNIRQGGLAIYGGLIAGVLTILVLSRIKKIPFLRILDTACIGVPIGQILGRWGNFFNREAFGSYTDNFLAMRISENQLHVGDQVGKDFLAQVELLQAKAIEGGYAGMIQVHPTFLYESLWNLAGLILLHFLSRKRRFDGQMFLCYLFWYGLGRAWIEGLRMDSLGSGAIRYSQVLAIVSCMLAAGAMVWVLCVKKPDPKRMLVHRCEIEQAGTEE